MRSVVVVLPASICAMIPMLRTLARSRAVSVATVARLLSQYVRRGFALPAVVRERLVGLGHLVRVLAPLDAGAEAVAGVEQLVHQALGHGLLAATAAVLDEPAQRERRLPRSADLDRDLVGRATHPAALDLDRRLHVVQRALEGDHRVVARLVAAPLERAVDDLLGHRPL